MRTLHFTAGSPFARAVRILLDELGLEYDRREAAADVPTLQVPALVDGGRTIWESGLIAEYLLAEYPDRPDASPPLARAAWRPEEAWHDRLVFATIQTFGTAATTISQLTWTGVRVGGNAHLDRCAARLVQILGWLEGQIGGEEDGFLPGCVSMQDLFLLAHVRFVEARPLGVDLRLGEVPRIARLLARLDERPAVRATPVLWWEPGLVEYAADGSPVREG
jgi:glutathione S-transferase